jgi:phosphohistidine phosphatase
MLARENRPAVRRLYVLRHAKSSWEDPTLEDRERSLAPRGRRAVKLLRDYLRENHIEPAQVLCSPARRTVETYHGVAPPGEVLVEPALYDATASELLERLHSVPAAAESVMIIGHNPTVQGLVLKLARPQDGGQLSEVARKFPTGALATLEFSCAWSELSPGCARLTGFVRSRSLG